MEMNIHKLKTSRENFHEVFMGRKTFEVRKNDMNFQKNDIILFREWDDDLQEYTGRQMVRRISYIQFSVVDGYVIMALA